ncbi:FecCD family ABC transporter permease [Bacillus taeanensis]|uniref:Iron ABC transporter n=1 Tax=Bacillus taeanensis TaxID=273032 RepID=A0A366XQ46_9BACI|nr:iron ABC transporter permease [Bacillus taeanensis]RBW68037.1 iron ABC transporter [Bacillus taeanensis]
MKKVLATNAGKTGGIFIGIIFVLLLMFASIIFGFTNITLNMVIESYTNFNGSNEHIIIQETRIPRAVIAAAVGGSLAVSGAIMQGLTRNPLASPSLFGVNAGASFFIVIAVTFFSLSSLSAFKWFAFGGAALASVIVYLLGSLGRDGLTPTKLTLAGAAIAALFFSMTQGMLVLNEKALEEVLFWLAGSVEGRSLEMLFSMLPYLLTGWVAALLIAAKMNILTAGEDVARGLGQRTVLVKIASGIIVVLLAGSSVAIAGPIGFVGLVIPNIVRGMIGVDYRWVIPYCWLMGAILLLLADITARYVIMPQEAPVGVMTAVVGAPFFIYLARKGVQQS